MNFKKLSALLLSITVLGAMTACSDDSSSSSKKEASSEISVSESSDSTKDSSSAESESKTESSSASDISSSSTADEATTSSADSSSSSSDDTAVNNGKSAEELIQSFDSEHPEETVKELLNQGFATAFKDHMKIEYDDSSKTYKVSVWQDNFAAALDTEAGANALDSLSTNLTSALNTMTTQIRQIHKEANVEFNFLSDKDKSTPLLTILNGEITYNITK